MILIFLILVVAGFLFELLATFPDSLALTAVWWKRLSRLAWFIASVLWSTGAANQ